MSAYRLQSVPKLECCDTISPPCKQVRSCSGPAILHAGFAAVAERLFLAQKAVDQVLAARFAVHTDTRYAWHALSEARCHVYMASYICLLTPGECSPGARLTMYPCVINGCNTFFVGGLIFPVCSKYVDYVIDSGGTTNAFRLTVS